jgi:hypothetical protein
MLSVMIVNTSEIRDTWARQAYCTSVPAWLLILPIIWLTNYTILGTQKDVQLFAFLSL